MTTEVKSGPGPDVLFGHREQLERVLSCEGAGEKAFCLFRKIIRDHYASYRRDFDWRNGITPYRIFISEVMLQQTQTIRVAEKFPLFIAVFPDFASLAAASFAEVLGVWKGLGYNRRAKYLQEAARIIVDRYGELPKAKERLLQLPGIGPATAASIRVFAYNEPESFIETNIRTVYIHFFFTGSGKVPDARIMELVGMTVDHANPREWYYALMDYGVMLKKMVGNLSRRSSHYTQQSRFDGSDRQLRGQLLQLLLERGTICEDELADIMRVSAERCCRICDALCREGIVRKNGTALSLD